MAISPDTLVRSPDYDAVERRSLGEIVDGPGGGRCEYLGGTGNRRRPVGFHSLRNAGIHPPQDADEEEDEADTAPSDEDITDTLATDGTSLEPGVTHETYHPEQLFDEHLN